MFTFIVSHEKDKNVQSPLMDTVVFNVLALILTVSAKNNKVVLKNTKQKFK